MVQDDPTSFTPMHLRTEDAHFSLPVEMKGTIAGFTSYTPSDEELETCPKIHISSPRPWNPETVKFQKASRPLESVIRQARDARGISMVTSHHPSTHCEVGNIEIDNNPNTILDIDSVAVRLLNSVRTSRTSSVDVKMPLLTKTIDVGSTDIPIPYTFQSSARHTDVSAQDLTERWHISIKQAIKTL